MAGNWCTFRLGGQGLVHSPYYEIDVFYCIFFVLFSLTLLTMFIIYRCLVAFTMMSIVLNVITVLLGLLMYAKYYGCDPLNIKAIQRNDQIVPYYVMDIAGNIPGLPGIFLAGIFSSALATMSAAINTLAGTIYEDFIDNWIADGPHKDSKAAYIMKGISLSAGLVSTGLIFIIEHLGSVFDIAVTLRSAVEGPLLGLFILGLAFPMVGKKGAFIGGWASLIIMTWIMVMAKWHQVHKRIDNPNLPLSVENCSNNFHDIILNKTTSTILKREDEPFMLFRISMMYLVFLATLITVIVGLITSYFTGESKTNKVNPDYLTPIVRRFYQKTKYEEVALHELPLET